MARSVKELEELLAASKGKTKARDEMGDLTRGQEERGLDAPAFQGEDSPLVEGARELQKKALRAFYPEETEKSELESELADAMLKEAPVAPPVPVVDPIEAQSRDIDNRPASEFDTSLRPDTMAELSGVSDGSTESATVEQADILPTSTPLDDNVDAPSEPVDMPATRAAKKVAPPKTAQEKQLRKVTNQLAKEGKIAPEQKKDYLEMLLQEYRDARGARKEEIETASMHDAIINASTNFARMAGVDKQFLPQKESNLAGAARAEKASELQELLNQINVEKGLKGLKPAEITAYQQAQLDAGEDSRKIQREKLEFDKAVTLTKKFSPDSDPNSALSIGKRKIVRNMLGKEGAHLITDDMSADDIKQFQNFMSSSVKSSKYSNEQQRQEQIRRANKYDKLKEDDRKALEKVQERIAFGGRGGAKVIGTAIVKQRSILDGLDTIKGIEESGLIPTSQMGQELASIIANVLSSGGQATEGSIKGLMPDTAKRKYADMKTWLTSDPQGAMSPKMIDQFKDMLERENTFWRGKLEKQNKTLAAIAKSRLERKDENGFYVNKDLMNDFSFFLSTVDDERASDGESTEKVVRRKNKKTGQIEELIERNGKLYRK